MIKSEFRELLITKEQIEKLIIDSISVWTDIDIYVISLYVYDDCDNPCKPTVTLGYNTENQVQLEISKGFASDEGEARWNYAFWLQNSSFTFGKDETAETVKKWLIASGFPYLEDDDVSWNNEEIIEKASNITNAFVSILIEIVRDIHKQGLLTRKFGKELPIIIHELEYYDEIADQNIKANGEKLANDFAEWCLCC